MQIYKKCSVSLNDINNNYDDLVNIYPEDLYIPTRKYYETNFVDPLFAQYNYSSESKRKEAVCNDSRDTTRLREGRTYQRMFPTDKCPKGWISFEEYSKGKQGNKKQSSNYRSEADFTGYCFPEPLREGTFYSLDKKSYITTKEDVVPLTSGNGYITKRPTDYKHQSQRYSFLY